MPGTTENTGDSLRDALSASLTTLESASPAPAPAAPVSAPAADTTPTAAPAPSSASLAPAQAPAPAAAAPASQEGVTAPAPGPERNPDGTFKAKAAETPVAAPVVDPNAPAQAPVAAPAPTMATQERFARAPGSWTPAAREHWASIPVEVREEVMRRETEVGRALSVSTQARKFAQEFEQVVAPYHGFIAAEGSTPLKAFEYMMQTGALLRIGTPAQKANAVASIVKQYGIDLHMLDSVLAGQQPRDNPAALVQAEVQRALAPIQQQIQQRQQVQSSQIDQQVEQDLNAFASDPKNEFFDDVRDLMGDLIDLASKRGQSMSLTDAYERATLMHEPVRRVIEQRRTQAASQANQLVAQNARNAAISIQPSAVLNTTHETPGDSIRSAIEHALSSTQG